MAKRRARLAGLATIGILLAFACGERDESQESAPAAAPIAKVRVYRDGSVTLNDSAIPLDELPAALADLQEQNGIVWYYREDAETEPHPNAVTVIQAIVEARVPVSMSSEEDFSNVVFPDGTTRPRPPNEPAPQRRDR